MYVIKRDGRNEPVKFDKITARIERLCYGLNNQYVQPIEVAMKVIGGIYEGVTTNELDSLAAEVAASLTTKHPDYAILAARIAVSNLHKETKKSFSDTMADLYNYIDKETNQVAALIADDVIEIIQKNADILDASIIYSRDYEYDYFGFKTLERSYLLKIDGKIVERPQQMLMRVAVGIHKTDINAAIETYNLMSERWYTHATPTLFNAGTPKPQMSSCFVAGTKVFTVNKGVVNIEDVQINDLVITHKGNIKPVVQLHKNPLENRQIYNFKMYGSPNMQVTENHKFWSISGEQSEWNEKPQWNTVGYLREGDYIAIPNKKEDYTPTVVDLEGYVPEIYGNIQLNYYTENNYIYPQSVWERQHKLNDTDTVVMVHKKHSPIKRFVTIDQDFAFFLGVWIGDGHIITGTNADKTQRFKRGIGLTFHKDAIDLIYKLATYAEETFGISPHISKPTTTNTISLSLHSHVLANFFKLDCGQGFNHKKLPEYAYRWDKKMVQSFMEGLVTSDGCVTKDGDVRISLANIPLVKSIFALCRGVGIAVSYSESTQLKKGATQLLGRIALPKQSILLENVSKLYDDDRLFIMKDKKSVSNSIKEFDGQTFIRISRKEKTDFAPEYVYTLGVQDDHSYVVEGVMAQNCFLLTMQDDSIHGIYDTLKQCAKISQSAGGIGLSIHNIRATGSYIKGTNGTSNGIVPMLRVFNDTARYVDQGGGKRKGSFAIYLEPWHADIFQFLELKKNHGKEEMRARDLFYALWISDLFMKRVEADGDWSLFCPNEAPGLYDAYGDEFEKLYEEYEQAGKARRTIKAQELWFKILESQIETGTPYILYKDAANKKSNQKNLGTIRSSNLCTEILEYTSPDEVAVCNLASIALPRFVDVKLKQFDFKKLYDVAYAATINLNKVIDVNYYPIEEARRSNMRHRPIGIGVQGLADAFILLRHPFESNEARQLNKDIFETVYFAAMTASKDLAKIDGTYETYKGSPISKGIFQYDFWDVTPTNRWDWASLKAEVKKHGVRNSLLLAPMPTASTSQILGNNECFEPYTSNIYSRRVLSGEFVVVNKHLLKDLIELNLWDDKMKNQLIAENGSVQNLNIPDDLKELYKTAWEIKQRTIIDMAAERGAYICQSQSMNIFMENANFGKLTSMHFYSWKRGLKTGIYYLRTKAAVDAIKFTVDKAALQENAAITMTEHPDVLLGTQAHVAVDKTLADAQIAQIACSLDNPDSCEMCGS